MWQRNNNNHHHHHKDSQYTFQQSATWDEQQNKLLLFGLSCSFAQLENAQRERTMKRMHWYIFCLTFWVSGTARKMGSLLFSCCCRCCCSRSKSIASYNEHMTMTSPAPVDHLFFTWNSIKCKCDFRLPFLPQFVFGMAWLVGPS